MMEMMDIKRGEIYFVCLDPVFGREMGGFKMRPVVVVSINDINSNPAIRLITVVPGTGTEHDNRRFPNVVRVDPNKDIVKLDQDLGLEKVTNFQCHQVRAIEPGRITQRVRGRISRKKLVRRNRKGTRVLPGAKP